MWMVYNCEYDERRIMTHTPFSSDADYYLAISPALDVLVGDYDVIGISDTERVLMDHDGHAFRIIRE